MVDIERLKERLREVCNGHPYAKIPWPHRLLHDADDTITALLSQLEEMREALGEFVEVTIDIGVAYGEDENANAQLMAAFKRMAEAADKADALLSQTDEGERMEGDEE